MSWFVRWFEATFDPWPGGTKHAYQTWLNHALVCMVACCPFAVVRAFGGPDIVAWIATIMLLGYAIKEYRDGYKGLDTFGDLAGPLLVCALAWLIAS